MLLYILKAVVKLDSQALLRANHCPLWLQSMLQYLQQ